ncbi:MAG TPA: IPT/TIG domain-containing protein [Candidatus Lumbricidophila sp.]|nr:IPT/TIG domain-containing protein [Candidatus Lumbricidophila sp.]
MAGDTAHAKAQYLSGSALNGIDLSALASVAGEQADSTGTAPQTNQSNLNLTALSSVSVGVAGGIQVPLSFANAGVVSQYAHAGTDASSVGASGLVSDQGVVGTAVDGANPPGPLTADLSPVLTSLGLASVIDTANLAVGATAARAEVAQGGVPVGTYQIASGGLAIHSPVLANIPGAVNTAVSNVQSAVDALAGPSGIGNVLLNTASSALPLLDAGTATATVTINPTLASQVSTLLAAPLSGGGVTVDLTTGSVSVDLDQVAGGLNGRAPNTDILTAATLTAIANQVNSLVTTRLNAIGTAVTTAVQNATVAADAKLTVPITGATALDVSLTGTLSDVHSGAAAPTLTAFGGTVIPGGLAASLATNLATVTDPVFATTLPALTTALTNQATAVSTTLAPAINALNQAVQLTVNVQDTPPVQGQVFTERALRIGLVPGAAVTTLNLATAIVGPNVTAVAPSILSLTPPSGPEAGGTSVVVTGTGFTNASDVRVDGATVPFTVTDDSHITLTTNAHAPSTVDVSVTTPTGTATLPASFTFLPAPVGPTAASLTPDSGPEAGGTVVTVTGTGFVSGSTDVNIGGATVPATVTSPTTLTFTTPAHAPGNVAVSVTTPAGTSSDIPGGFTFLPAPVGPTAASLTPDSGPEAGGTVVTITGSGFVQGSTTVNIDGVSVPATVTSPTTLTFTTPAHAPGNVAVSVTTPAGTSPDVPGGFTFLPAPVGPTAASLTPDNGPAAGGTGVTVTGSGFVPGSTSVNIGGFTVPATVNSPTQLSFVTPAHVPGNVAVSVTTPSGTSADIPGGFTYTLLAAAPTATSLSPNHGPAAGGTTVTVTGSGFIPGATTVSIDGFTVPATVSSPTELTFTTPAHAPGNVAVSVTTPGGTSADVPGGFTFDPASVTGIAPPAGPTAGGTTVVITGSCFVNVTDVTFGGTSAASFTVDSPTQITATTPAGVGAVDVSVISSGQCGTGTAPGGFTYVPAPTLLSLTPNHGPASGGTTVTITGSNFTGATEVAIDGVPVASFTVLSDSQISFVTPLHVAETVDVSVTAAGGTGTLPNSYTFEPMSITSIDPNSGPEQGGNVITIDGSCFTDATEVWFGPSRAPWFEVLNDAQIKVSLPSGTGAVDVRVVGSAACANASVPGGYTYLPAQRAGWDIAMTPNHGPDTGGTLVTLTSAPDSDSTGSTGSIAGGATASNPLQAAQWVTVDGMPVTFTQLDDNTITFETPAHAASAEEVVVTNELGVSPPLPFTFISTAGSAAPGGGQPTLARTGADPSTLWLLVLVGLVGGTVLMITARRRKSH